MSENTESSLDSLADTAELQATPVPEVEAVAQPSEEAAAPKAPDPIDGIQIKAQNVFISMNPLSEDTSAAISKGKPFITLPSNFPTEVMKSIRDLPNVDMGDTKKQAEWLETVNNGFEEGLMAQNNRGMGALEDPTAKWEQKIPSSIGDLYGRTPTFPAVNNESLSGEKALLRFMNYTGLGTIFKVPLYHTGIWITFKAPSEGRLLELHREMVEDRLGVGRDTHGLSFANTAAYHNESLFNLAIEHIYQISVATDKPLRSIISVHDIPTMIWGLACTIWNTGYPYRRACTYSPEKCNYVAEAKISLAKLMWTNTNALTDWQMRHMTSHQQNSMRIEDVERYKNESTKSQKTQIVLNENTERPFNVTTRVPSAGEYFDMARRWLGEIVRVIEVAVGNDATSAEKQNEIMNACKATMMRQYGHWVESVDFDSNTISERDTIEMILDRLSADDDARVDFIEKVTKYIEHSTISLFGIPTYNCPNCKGEQHIEGTAEGASSILPIDMASTFFILHVQKRQQITLR